MQRESNSGRMLRFQMLLRIAGGRRVLYRRYAREGTEILLQPWKLTEFPPKEAFKKAGFKGNEATGKHYKR